MNIFIVAEWVWFIPENYERTRVFKTQSYDSAKGWDFTQSPCFYFPATLQYGIMGCLYITSPLTPER